MGVDWYACEKCGDTFPDCGDYVYCEFCGKSWCCDECADKDGHQYSHCKLGKDTDYGRCEEDCEFADEDGNCDDCKNFVTDSCKYCRKEDFSDELLLDKAMSLLGMNREDLIAKMKGE